MLGRYEEFDTENKLIRNFWEIGHTMRHISEGKGSQKRILMVLLENRSMTQSALTEYLGIQPGSASEVLGKLEAAGLIRRTPSQADRRTTELCLTPAGEKEARQAYARREQRHREMFACFTEEEKQSLVRLLEQLNSYWERQYGAGGARQPRGENGGKTHPCGNI